MQPRELSYASLRHTVAQLEWTLKVSRPASILHMGTLSRIKNFE